MTTAPALTVKQHQRLDHTECPPWPPPADPPLQGVSFGYRLHNGDDAARQIARRAMLESGGNIVRFRRLIEGVEGITVGRRTPYQWLKKFAPLRWARKQACAAGPSTTADDLLAYPCERCLVITARALRDHENKIRGWKAELAADGVIVHRVEGADRPEAIERLIAALGNSA